MFYHFKVGFRALISKVDVLSLFFFLFVCFARHGILEKVAYIQVVLRAKVCYLPGGDLACLFCKFDQNFWVSGCDRCSFLVILKNSIDSWGE